MTEKQIDGQPELSLRSKKPLWDRVRRAFVQTFLQHAASAWGPQTIKTWGALEEVSEVGCSGPPC